MIPQRREIFCIIVHFGLEKTTNTLIAQLLRGTTAPHHIIIVDNQGDFALQDTENARVVVKRNKKNTGYAGGIATGLRVLRSFRVQESDIVLCLNNDLTVSTETLTRVHEQLNEDDQKIGGDQVWGINMFTGRAIQKEYGESCPWYVLPYVHGSFLGASYENWQKIFPLPTDYFMYWEDVLISLRALGTGLELVAFSDTGIEHDDRVQPLTDSQTYYLVRNGASFLRTYTPPVWRMYWKAMHTLRVLHHRTLGGKLVVLRALRDSKKV